MFRHILLPTDGSALAAKGVKAGVRLAKSLGARVTGVYVSAPYVPPLPPEAAVVQLSGMAPDDYRKAVEAIGSKALAALERVARSADVRCATQLVTEASPWRGILKVARARKCDAIAMASHGRGGIGGLLLGGQASRVLAHSSIPVLVVR